MTMNAATKGAMVGETAGNIYGNATSGYSQDLTNIANQIGQLIQQGISYLLPYESTGREAMGKYYTGVQELAHPIDIYNEIMKTYSLSPSAQFEMNQGLEAINSSMASKGMLGSTAQGRQLESYSEGLTSKDMQTYLENILGLGKGYFSGLRNLTNTGLSSAADIANLFAEQAQIEGSVEAASAAAKARQQQASSGGIGALVGGTIGGVTSALGF